MALSDYTRDDDGSLFFSMEHGTRVVKPPEQFLREELEEWLEDEMEGAHAKRRAWANQRHEPGIEDHMCQWVADQENAEMLRYAALATVRRKLETLREKYPAEGV